MNLLIYSLATTYPDSTDSPLPHFVHVLNRELSKKGFIVEVITQHLPGTKIKEKIDDVLVYRFRYLPEKNELKPLPIPDQIKKSKLKFVKVMMMVLAFGIFTFLKCSRKKPDIIHGHWAFPCGFFASLLGRIFKVKSVITAYGGEIPLIQKSNFIKKITIPNMNKASIVLADSSFIKNELIKLGVKEEKIVVHRLAPNFVPHTKDESLVREFRKTIAKDDEKIVLFVGRLVERKGVDYLIKSLKEVKSNVRLVIAGKGEQLEPLKNLVKSLSLEDRVTFSVGPSHKELGKLHDISDVFVCPSIIDKKGETEGLGLVNVEAMESGIPVIASRVGGIVDVVKDNINGVLSEPKNPSSIAFAIDKILSDDKFREMIIQNGKKTAIEYSPKAVAEQHLETYQSLFC